MGYVFMNLDKSNINNEILDKIDNINQPDNVKEFIKQLLEFEYEVSDRTKPTFSNKYKKFVKEYKDK